MTRFGGSNKSWLFESFFPTPADLCDVLGELQPKLLVTNTRVASDYVSTPLAAWLRAYQRYVARAVSGKPITWRLSSHLHISLTDPAVRIHEEPIHGKPFKLLEPSQPLVELAPQLLYYDAGRLSLKIYNLDDAAAFGLEISLQRASQRQKNYALFQQLCEQLRERSRPCVFVAGKKRLRPKLYLSTGFGAEINRHAYLKQCRLKVAAA